MKNPEDQQKEYYLKFIQLLSPDAQAYYRGALCCFGTKAHRDYGQGDDWRSAAFDAAKNHIFKQREEAMTDLAKKMLERFEQATKN